MKIKWLSSSCDSISENVGHNWRKQTSREMHLFLPQALEQDSMVGIWVSYHDSKKLTLGTGACKMRGTRPSAWAPHTRNFPWQPQVTALDSLQERTLSCWMCWPGGLFLGEGWEDLSFTCSWTYQFIRIKLAWKLIQQGLVSSFSKASLLACNKDLRKVIFKKNPHFPCGEREWGSRDLGLTSHSYSVDLSLLMKYTSL